MNLAPVFPLKRDDQNGYAMMTEVKRLVAFHLKNLLLTKSAKKYLDSKKHIQAPSVEAKDTKITPSTTPNKAPAATVKTPGKNGKDNPAKMMYEMKKTNLDNTISLLAHIINQLTFCFKLSKFKISWR